MNDRAAELTTSLVLAAALAACSPPPSASRAVVWQNMPVIALLNGDYAGITTVGEAKRHGSQGVGAFADIDGEMLAIDGTVYWVTPDGKVHEPADTTRMSFAVMSDFQADGEIEIPVGTTFENLGLVVDSLLPTVNAVYVLRVDGAFSAMTTRALPKQQRPFPPLCQAVKEQPTFDLSNTTGVAVGFRGPPYVTTFNTPGYHLHFLNADKQAGGHVLSFVVAKAVLKWQRLDAMHIEMPRDKAFDTIDLSQIDQCAP